MDRAGATIYRQDFNISPAGVWVGADADDRRGMTENLDPTATYCVRSCDSGEVLHCSGGALMSEGVTVAGGPMVSRLLVLSAEM